MSSETISVCPVCQGSDFTWYLACRDNTVSQEVFQLEKCEQCQLVITNPRPDEQSIGAYYQSDAYISHSNTRAGLIARAYHVVRRVALRNKLRLINSIVPRKGTLLDIGCGTGLFAAVCQRDGWRVTSVEPDSSARKLAETGLNQPIYPTIWDIQEPHSFQLITLWHVLEHVHKLNETLNWIATHLDARGTLLIAVPNHRSADAQTYAQHWAAYDVPRHLYHFTPQTLAALLARHGFKLQATHPMPFDAYYVSLLSSRYQYGRVKYAEALWRGLTSNQTAARTGQYSSLIYLFEKAAPR